MALNWQRFRVRLALTGLTDAQTAADLSDLQAELELWDEVLWNPRVRAEPAGRRVVVEIDVEDSDPDNAALQASETIQKIAYAMLTDPDAVECVTLEARSLGPAPPRGTPDGDAI